MVREADEKFIECLKHEMLENRTCDVAPIVATVRLSDEQFDMKHPEAYTYDTIGGNHSRIALQQLIKENQELAKDPTFSSRRVSVYGRLSAEQAQHLAHRHNRATEFTSKMNTQDKQYEHFADEKVLRDLFLQLKSCPIPAAFNEYCAKALNSKLAGTKSSEIDARTAAVWSEDRSSLTILIPQTITMLCFEDIKKNVRKSGIQRLRDSSVCEFKNGSSAKFGSISILKEGPIAMLDVLAKLPESILETLTVSDLYLHRMF
eukprot:Em0007g452a